MRFSRMNTHTHTHAQYVQPASRGKQLLLSSDERIRKMTQRN
uniref:Uncharacterized protein n=1 Tax=Anguilla anguilla TaxID=7936 RepID=A0A0E9VZT7_ANGAN